MNLGQIKKEKDFVEVVVFSTLKKDAKEIFPLWPWKKNQGIYCDSLCFESAEDARKYLEELARGAEKITHEEPAGLKEDLQTINEGYLIIGSACAIITDLYEKEEQEQEYRYMEPNAL